MVYNIDKLGSKEYTQRMHNRLEEMFAAQQRIPSVEATAVQELETLRILVTKVRAQLRKMDHGILCHIVGG